MRDLYLLHGEDSSDDELEDSKSDAESIDASFIRFIEAYKKSNSMLFRLDKGLEHKLQDCFVAHYLGLGLLYRPDVQKRYLTVEKQALKYELPLIEASKIPEGQLKEWVALAIKSTIQHILVIEALEISRQKTKEFLETQQALIQMIVAKLCVEPEQLLYYFRRPRFLLRIVGTELKQLENLIQAAIADIATASPYKTSLKLKELYTPPRKLSNPKKKARTEKKDTPEKENSTGIKEYLKEQLKVELEILTKNVSNNIVTLLIQLGLFPNEQPDPDFKWYTPMLAEAFAFICIDSTPYQKFINGEPGGDDTIDLDSILASHMETLLKAYSEDLLNQEKSSSLLDSILFQRATDYSIPERSRTALFRKLALTAERVTSLYQHHHLNSKGIADLITKQLAKTYSVQIKRKILPRRFVFNSQSLIGLLANLRLSNRSQRRQIRNLRSSKDNLGEITTFIWQMSNFITRESQEITKNYARTDLVKPLGKYPAIAKRIEKFKNTDITDIVIAELISKILRGEDINNLSTPNTKDSQSQEQNENENEEEKEENDDEGDPNIPWEQFLVSLTYLLFGTEVVRNPACLIVHQMALELIKAKQLTWQQFFTPQGFSIEPVFLKKDVSIDDEIKSIQFHQIGHQKGKLFFSYDEKNKETGATFVYFNDKNKKITEIFYFTILQEEKQNLELWVKQEDRQHIQQYLDKDERLIQLLPKPSDVYKEFIYLICLQLVNTGVLIAAKLSYAHQNRAFGGGGLMPMSMDEEAVRCARYLCSAFNNYVPLNYQYEGEPQSLGGKGRTKIDEMITRTHLIFGKWLQYKGITRKDEWINQLITAMQIWYPPLDDKDKPSDKDPPGKKDVDKKPPESGAGKDKSIPIQNISYFFQDDRLIPFIEQKIVGDGNCTFNSPAQGIEQCFDETIKLEIRTSLKTFLGDTIEDLKEINHVILRQAVVKRLAQKVKDEKDFPNIVIRAGLIPLLRDRYESILELIKDNDLLVARVTSAHDQYYHAGLQDEALAQLYLELIEIPKMWTGDIEIPIIEELCNIRLDIRQQVIIDRPTKVMKLQTLIKDKAESKILKSSYEILVRNELKTALIQAHNVGVKNLNLENKLAKKVLNTLNPLCTVQGILDPVQLDEYLQKPTALQLYYDWFLYAPVCTHIGNLEQDITQQCHVSKYGIQGLTQERLQQIDEHDVRIGNTFFAYFSYGSTLSERTERLEQVPELRRLIVIYRGNHYNLVKPPLEQEPILLTAPKSTSIVPHSPLVSLSALTQSKSASDSSTSLPLSGSEVPISPLSKSPLAALSLVNQSQPTVSQTISGVSQSADSGSLSNIV